MIEVAASENHPISPYGNVRLAMLKNKIERSAVVAELEKCHAWLLHLSFKDKSTAGAVQSHSSGVIDAVIGILEQELSKFFIVS